MSDPFDHIRVRLTARLASLGPKPRWWQRRRLKAWGHAAVAAGIDALRATIELAMAPTIVPIVIGEPFVESPRSYQERARRILKGDVN